MSEDPEVFDEVPEEGYQPTREEWRRVDNLIVLLALTMLRKLLRRERWTKAIQRRVMKRLDYLIDRYRNPPL